MPYRLYLRIFAIISLSAIAASAAHACTCPPVQDAAEQAASSDAVIVGTVTKIDTTEEKNGPYLIRSHTNTVRLAGSSNVHVTVSTVGSGLPTCGLSFSEGQEIKILVRGSAKAGYSAGGCAWARFSLEDYDAAFAAKQPEDIGD